MPSVKRDVNRRSREPVGRRVLDGYSLVPIMLPRRFRRPKTGTSRPKTVATIAFSCNRPAMATGTLSHRHKFASG